MAGITKRIDIFLNGDKAGATIGDLKRNIRLLNNEINQLTPGTEAYNKKIRELAALNGQLDQHRARIRGIGGAFGGLKDSAGQLKQFFLGPFGLIGILAGVGAAIKNWVGANREIEKSLSSLRSLTGASTEDLAIYKKEAIEMGRTTTLSATEAVDAFKMVGSVRPELLKNRDALIEVTKEAVTLAEASEMELGGSTQAMIGIMNQFGLENTEASRTINVLAAGSKEGAAGIEELSKSTDKSGTVAAAYNVTLEENIGLLETLAEKNLKSEEAGTQLRNVLLKMQTIQALPASAIDELERYGVNTQLVADKTVPFNERLKEMSKIAADATAITKVFGTENVVAAGIILNNTDKVNAYTKAVTGTNTAYEQAAINTDNFDGDLKNLSSAWEGLNLTIEGSTSILRPFTQAVTNSINWVTGLVKAMKEGDSVKMETSVLQLTKAFSYLNPVTFLFGDNLRKSIDEQIRFNELTSGVVDSIKVESREVDILTTAIAENNYVLANSNLSEEETVRLHEENEKMVSELKNRYPELTAEIDFQTISYQELGTLQKEITANILDQAIETAKAAEQEKILNEIISQSIELSKQRAKENERWSITNWVADYYADSSADIEESIDDEKKKLMELDKTFQDVEATVKGLDLNFGEDFDTNTKLIIEAQNQMQKFNTALANATSENEKLVIQAQIEAGKRLLASSGKIRKDQIDAIIAGGEAQTEKVVELTEAEIKAEKVARQRAGEKAAEERKRNLEKLQNELENVIEAVAKFQQDATDAAKVAGQTTEEGKELAELEISLQNKYQKQIEAAQKLAKGTGDIAIQAQEQLTMLEVLKTAETEEKKEAIRKKYEEERFKQAQKDNEHLVALELNAQATLHDLKVKQAAANLNDLSLMELDQQKLAIDAYNQALIDQLEFEKQLKIDALIQQFADDQINQADFYAQKEALEIDHQARLTEISNQGAKERQEAIANQVMSLTGVISDGLNIIGTFRQAGLNKMLGETQKNKEIALAQLQDEKNKGIITEEEYLNKKKQLEVKFDRENAHLKKRAAEKERAASIIQAAINGLEAGVKAIAMFGPPPSPLGIAGIASAAATTIANIALIRSQPLPQFKDGGYHNVIGASDGKSYNAKMIGRHRGGMLPGSPSLILASERGPEYYVPNNLLGNPAVANYVGMIEAIRLNQMAVGGYTKAPDVNLPVNNEMMALIGLIGKNTAALELLTLILPNLKAELNLKQVDDISNAQKELANIRA